MIEETKSIFAPFDYYELRARIIPAILIFSPIILTSVDVAYFVTGSASWTAGTGVIFLVVIYAFSFIVRALGKGIEADLWAGWNGPPSTRFMRWNDGALSIQTKRAYHDAVKSELGIQLKEIEEERINPDDADKLIMDAFRQVKSMARIHNGKGLWNAHNAEYGFLRNVVGSILLWLVLSLLATAICGYLYYVEPSEFTLICLIGNAFLAVLALVSRLFRAWLINLTKQVADRYAESTWGSFMAVHRKQKD